MRVEAAERRSTRLEPNRQVTTPVASRVGGGAHVPEDLDWQTFAAAYFPGRRRHDLEALTAYGVYRRSHAADARSSDEPARIGAGPGEAGSTALQDWEDEGGAAL
jgi:hypothetical protein